jgi:hypothetical protein
VIKLPRDEFADTHFAREEMNKMTTPDQKLIDRFTWQLERALAEVLVADVKDGGHANLIDILELCDHAAEAAERVASMLKAAAERLDGVDK